MTDHARTIAEILHHTARARYRDILADAIGHLGAVVQDGLFAGMALPARASWGDGDMLAKLIGCYEQELNETIARAIGDDPVLVINIGAAEGYYAIGLARLLPNAAVYAFDTDEQAQDICREATRLNGVDRRVTVGGHCSPDHLQSLLAHSATALVVCDCEGGEIDLIDPVRVPGLKSAALIVECHDFIVQGCTQTLIDRLGATHDMYVVTEGGRNPNALPFLQRYSSLDRWIAVCEFRPNMMHWLIAWPK